VYSTGETVDTGDDPDWRVRVFFEFFFDLFDSDNDGSGHRRSYDDRHSRERHEAPPREHHDRRDGDKREDDKRP
jgi:hypothetical protein